MFRLFGPVLIATLAVTAAVRGGEFDHESGDRQELPALRAAAQSGDARAMTVLGWRLANGVGAKQDTGEARRWWLRAAADGQVRAMTRLGYPQFHSDLDAFWLPAAVNQELLTQAAEAGDPLAMAALGQAYAYGRGVPRSREPSQSWLRRAADAGSVAAMARLAWVYREGRGVRMDEAEVKNWAARAVRQAAQAGESLSPEDLCELARVLSRGVGVEKDVKAAASYADRAAATGDVVGIATAAVYAEAWGRPADAVRRWSDAAERGHLGSIKALAMAYADGNGIPKNGDEALRLLNQAVARGDGEAALVISNLHQSGAFGVPDLRLAEQWMERAADLREPRALAAKVKLLGVRGDWAAARSLYQSEAERGSLKAMNGLGTLYQFGLGGAGDDAQAARWLVEAATWGDPEAMNNLGMLYLKGTGVRKDAQAAVSWLRDAATALNPAAMFNLGTCYESGEGVRQDLPEARRQYERAARAGDKDGMYKFAGFCAEGRGGERSDDLAVTFFGRAAALGHADAMFRLGLINVEGRGVPRDPRKGIELVRAAAQKGSAEAAEWLKRQATN